jgi:hypothetical protein
MKNKPILSEETSKS